MEIPDKFNSIPPAKPGWLLNMLRRGEVIQGYSIKGTALEEDLHEAMFQGIPVRLYGCLIDGDLDFTKGLPVDLANEKGLPQDLQERLRERGIREGVLVRGDLQISDSFITGNVLGTSVIFPKGSFPGTNVGTHAGFTHALFGDYAIFSGCTFWDRATFRFATFGDVAAFMGTAFRVGANFKHANFGHGVGFGGATFGDGTDFEHAIFGDEAGFSGANFGKGAGFGGATFLEEVIFEGARERKDENGKITVEENLVFRGEVDFSSVTLRAPQKVRFQTVNLTQARFLHTPIDKVQFIDVDWYDRGDGKRALYDEKFAEEEGYELVAQLYRQLKKNYEEKRAYPEAGDFHYGEMEMTLRQEEKEWKEESKWWSKGKKWFAWFLTRSYKFLSGYGEMPGWAIGVAAGIWLIPAAIYFMAALVISSDLNFAAVLKVLLYSLGESLQAMTFRLPKFQDVHLAKIPFMLLQALLGPIQIALVALALRRKFRR